MTQVLFQDALLNYYTSKMEKCCLENSIPFTILRIVDNAPRHLPVLGHPHPNVRMVFLLQTPPLGSNQCIKQLGIAQAITAAEEDADAILEGFSHL